MSDPLTGTGSDADADADRDASTGRDAGTGPDADAALLDAVARALIRTNLGSTLFVDAGAGSGKTRSLVERVVATVLADDAAVPLRAIAVVTFTEKAGAELTDRLRAKFEAALRNAPAGSRRAIRARAALDDLDAAAIGTLHSFAERILREHPIEAGIPPLLEVQDDVASGVAFDDRWTVLRSRLLDDQQLSDPLLLLLSAGVRLDHLRDLARIFNQNWDLLQSRVLDVPASAPPVLAVDDLIARAEELAALRDYCVTEDDKYLPVLDSVAEWADRLRAAADDPARIAVLAQTKPLSGRHGRQANWQGCSLDDIKSRCKHLVADATAARTAVVHAALTALARYIARATQDAARGRQATGRLEFHDLLVLARELLTNPDHGTDVRAALHQRYQRLLLDEFQDTDPIQIEIAVRIAAGTAGGAPDWADVPIPPGRLFVVGDPKQSIYRFRRADIATYLEAQRRIGDSVVLNTNFRSTGPLLDWINWTFERLIRAEPDTQPPYIRLDAHRPEAPCGPAVLLLGAAQHEDAPNADELRRREAADVIRAVRTALADGWQVERDSADASAAGPDNTAAGPDNTAAYPGSAAMAGPGEPAVRWRPVELRDIAILVPSRTSLPILEAALDEAGIAYRAEASSLVYRTREVRDLLMAARAAEDPSDALALTAALRSPLFGCGDDDLWTWHRAGGRWNITAPDPDGVPTDHPVLDAVRYLRRLHRDRVWLAPSEVLTRLVTDRRMLEIAAGGRQGRDVWRRLRFVVDQARAWAETTGGGLRAYLAWARRQAEESARVAEAILPETDVDALRIMTIHAAKGLEFPVVILSGLTARPGGVPAAADVLWPRDDGFDVRLPADVRTRGYNDAKPIDEQMDHHERLRLLYVACTRARDHLVVSLHRRARSHPASGESAMTSAELLAGASTGGPAARQLPAAPRPAPAVAVAARPPALPPPPLPEWQAQIERIRQRSAEPAAVGASRLEGSGPAGQARPAPSDLAGQPADPGLAKDARDLELPPWNKGRYGTAIGRAVHGVLQAVDLATGQGLDDAVAAQVLAEGVAEHAQVVARLARAALNASVVRRAAARRHWRETYAGTVVPTGSDAGTITLEGVIDLLYRDDDGLVIVDYKTDSVTAAGLDRKVTFYRPQLAAYALAIRDATGGPLPRCVLIFLTPDGAIERTVDGIAEAAAALPAALDLARAGADAG